ncbi:hypothetical protein IM876_09235 [Serratia plymuthica]|uniref:hypothetical protein n=1 Tax=Serratia plymuthica TaxID=82996 RepID=UPI001927EC0F|nr:hypothetical protein [Serratia plymuthica]MBL3522846.1 hypothetical protein [Serratia plymuthica]
MKELDSFTIGKLKAIIDRCGNGEARRGLFDKDEVERLARIALAAKQAEPVAYVTYKGYLIHAGDPKLSEYSDPTPLYDVPALSYPESNYSWEDCPVNILPDGKADSDASDQRQLSVRVHYNTMPETPTTEK